MIRHTAKFIFQIVFYAALAAVVIYIMGNGLGLVNGLDFGAGAYYYADIPQFGKYVNGSHFHTQFPMWFHIALFLIWGGVMYKFWIWLDKKLNKEQETSGNLEKIFENKAPGFCYTRVANPTVTAFENRITKLEGGIASVACASGMAALTNAFLNILQSGDEIGSSAGFYGGSIDLFRDLETFGITTKMDRWLL